jgi:hypothetical protein
MSDEKQLYVGDVWEIDNEAEATRTKAATDPDGLHVNVIRGDGSSMTVTPTKTATGIYYVVIPLTVPGTWHATWVANEGEHQGVETISTRVLIAPLTP